MKQSYLVAMIFCVHLSGCVDLNEDEQLADQAQAETTQTRPSLASICSSACNNSHGMHKCVDAGSFAGPANVSVFPLIEGKTVVPSTTLGNNGSWANTSCPNCQWHLIAVTSDQNGEVVTTGLPRPPTTSTCSGPPAGTGRDTSPFRSSTRPMPPSASAT